MNDQQNYDFNIRALALQQASHLNGGTATTSTRGVDGLLQDAAKIEAYLRTGEKKGGTEAAQG